MIYQAAADWDWTKFLIALIVVGVVQYLYKKNKDKKQNVELEMKKERERVEELQKGERIAAKLSKISVLTHQIEEVTAIRIEPVNEFKNFIVENEPSIISKGGEGKLFEFMKLDTFLNDFRQKIISDIESIKTVYSRTELERAVKDYEAENPLVRISDHYDDVSRRISGQLGRSTNAKIEYLFEIGPKLSPSIHAELSTLHYYKSLAFAMILFYLGDKKIKFFEIYEAFEKLGVFDSSWQRNVASKLESIDLRLASMNNQMTRMNENFERLASNTDSLVNEIKSGLSDISGRLDLNNVLLGITAYQTYRANRNV